MLKIIEVNEVDQFFELEPIWNSLLSQSRDNNPFLTWEYLSTYWKHFSGNKKLKTLCVGDEKNDIIAIAPLRLSPYVLANTFTYNVIEPLACRGADYTGLIISKKEIECLKLILNYLAVKNEDWDFIYLYDIPETSSVPTYLVQMQKNSIIPYTAHQGAICPYLTIPKSIENLNTLKGKFRKNLRRCMKKLENDYKKVELTDYRSFNSIENAMNAFFDLHQQRWTLKNLPGVFNTEDTRHFFLDVAKRFAEKGWLALYFLMVNGNPVAAQLCYKYAQKMYYVLGGFNPEFSKYSVGNIITIKIIEECIKNHVKEYDFLKGGEPYKFEWTNNYRRNLGYRFVNNRKTISKTYNLAIKTLKKIKADKILGKILQF
jgi:CelD/BcsL family acetyltransferase involved in cellulose biosynthesis